ncbi:MAG: hypothetical protein H6Q89_2729 [Myxococcaceae bacterium]|nr:hypothetical protein [Myxococcaceae bacterium]
MEFGKRYAVFSVRKGDNNGAAIWVRAGYAWANRDGSANVALDVLPLDGKLHIREAGERREYAGSTTPQQKPKQPETQSMQLVDTQSMGGH